MSLEQQTLLASLKAEKAATPITDAAKRYDPDSLAEKLAIRSGLGEVPERGKVAEHFLLLQKKRPKSALRFRGMLRFRNEFRELQKANEKDAELLAEVLSDSYLTRETSWLFEEMGKKSGAEARKLFRDVIDSLHQKNADSFYSLFKSSRAGSSKQAKEKLQLEMMMNSALGGSNKSRVQMLTTASKQELTRMGVEFRERASGLFIQPVKGKTRLNELAYLLEEKYNVALRFEPGRLGNANASYTSDGVVNLPRWIAYEEVPRNHRSVIHEVGHAQLDFDRIQERDSLFHGTFESSVDNWMEEGGPQLGGLHPKLVGSGYANRLSISEAYTFSMSLVSHLGELAQGRIPQGLSEDGVIARRMVQSVRDLLDNTISSMKAERVYLGVAAEEDARAVDGFMSNGITSHRVPRISVSTDEFTLEMPLLDESSKNAFLRIKDRTDLFGPAASENTPSQRILTQNTEAKLKEMREMMAGLDKKLEALELKAPKGEGKSASPQALFKAVQEVEFYLKKYRLR